MMNHLKSEKIKGIIFLSALLSCFFAFFNKYPVVYPDTGTYIYSGFNDLVFDDRPIFYGFFLRHISLATSLWYVVFMQGLLICYMIFKTLGIFFEGNKKYYIFVAVVTFLTLFTGFSYTVSILIPDIFSAISILCLINLLLNKDLKWSQLTGISILFVFSVCTQFSNIAVMLLLFCFFLLYFIWKRLKKMEAYISFRRFTLSLSLFLSCLLVIPTVNFCVAKQFKISGSNHVFVMNHLIETGILQDYLDDNCEKYNFKICRFRGQLGWDFMWSTESPLQKTGGWKANEDEYNFIIKDILSKPDYLVLLSYKSLEYAMKQFFSFDLAVSPPQLENTAPFGQIQWRFKNTLFEYRSSLQNSTKLNVDFLNSLQRIVVLICIVFLFVILLSKSLHGWVGKELKWVILIIIIHNLLNSFVCSNLSTVDSRFQSRLVWLFPLCAIIVIVKFTMEKYRPKCKEI